MPGQRDNELAFLGVFAHTGMAAEAPFTFCRSPLMQEVEVRVLVT